MIDADKSVGETDELLVQKPKTTTVLSLLKVRRDPSSARHLPEAPTASPDPAPAEARRDDDTPASRNGRTSDRSVEAPADRRR